MTTVFQYDIHCALNDAFFGGSITTTAAILDSWLVFLDQPKCNFQSCCDRQSLLFIGSEKKNKEKNCSVRRSAAGGNKCL